MNWQSMLGHCHGLPDNCGKSTGILDLLHQGSEAFAACPPDSILIATDHHTYDYPFVLAHSPLIVDTRNVYPDPAATASKVFSA